MNTKLARLFRIAFLAALGLGFAAGSPCLADIQITGSIYDDNDFEYYVGYADFSTGTLTINAGSDLNRTHGHVGHGIGSTGTATVTGAGSTWTNDSLYVGYKGNGTLNIEAGGQVTNGYGRLGEYSGSTGTVIVTGAGSAWINNAYLYVGQSGSGTLTVADGGQVSAEYFYASLSDLYGNGTITVTRGAVLDADLLFDSTHGTSQALSFGSGGTLNLNVTSNWPAPLGAGYKRTGTIRIADGVTVASNLGYLGHRPGSTGTATVTGAGSTWANSRALYVGNEGSGTLNIEAGGQVSNTTGYLGRYSGSIGTATVTGVGSTWTNSSNLNIGRAGSGTLNIEAGGQVSNTTGDLGYNSGSTGTVTVTGTGSTWAHSGTLYVGVSGNGTLNIEAGGQVSNSTGYVGYASSSTGTVTITGAGSTWANSSKLYIGYKDHGSGTLNIEAGGQVSNTNGYLGYHSGSTGTVTVTGDSSKWINSGVLYVGNSGSGTLSIEAGGQVNNTSSYIGDGGIGMVTVTGAGSTWTNSQSLYVGRYGTGTLTVSDGGTVVAETLYASPSDLHGNGTISAHGAVLDADLVFDNTHGLAQTFSFGIGGTLNLNVTSAGDLGAGYKGTGTLRIADGVTVASNSGYLGHRPGSTGTATVTGAGSKWVNGSELHVGYVGTGTLNIEAGGQVSNTAGYLGRYSGSIGTATVTGVGSTWTNSSNLYVGRDGSGTLNIEAGGQVSNTTGYLGYAYGSGTATVTGAGSTWANSGSLYVGNSGTGTLTVSDGGQVVAKSAVVKSTSKVRLHVSGNNMFVLGDAGTTGSITNSGAVHFYADAFLPAGVYIPISEYADRAMTWSGSGTYGACGGTWDTTAKTFTVVAPTVLTAGASDTVSTGERLIFTDPVSGQSVGASFGTFIGGTTLSAYPTDQDKLDALVLEPGLQGWVFSAWDFDMNLTGGEVLLSFDIGLGAQDLGLWHYTAGAWSPYAADLMTYDSAGVVSFTASSFSGYAVTGIPEPATLSLLAAGVGALWLKRRRKA